MTKTTDAKALNFQPKPEPTRTQYHPNPPKTTHTEAKGEFEMKTKIAVVAAVLAGLALSGCTATKANMSGDIRDENTSLTGGIIDESGNAFAGDDGGSLEDPGFSDEIGDQRGEGVAEGDVRKNDPDLQQRLVYFDFDKSEIKPDQLAVIEAHARFMLANPDKGVLLEGHADERGSNEYNLALGQRRASAVMDIMLANGVDSYNLESVSFGEERPRVNESNESAWAQNRRVEIRYRDE